MGLSILMLLGWVAPVVAASLQEVSPPPIITQLGAADHRQPQVTILSPQPEEILNNNTVTVQLQVTGTPIFKNALFGLGPHLHLLLDGNPVQSVYDLDQPIVLDRLTSGTHNLQVLANKPWHESWKTTGAFAQVTFHVLAQSAIVPSDRPRLVYAPANQLGAEPFLVDFYLANLPANQPVQVRATINRQTFSLDRWQPFYFRGLQPGANVIQLEYLDDRGQAIDSSVRVIMYQPNGQDGLSRLMRNEIPLGSARSLFDANSRSTSLPTPNPAALIPVPMPPVPSPVTPSAIAIPVPTTPMATPMPMVPVPSSTVAANPIPPTSPQSPIPNPIAPLPIPSPIASPSPVPSPMASPVFSSVPSPVAIAPPSPVATPIIVKPPSPIVNPVVDLVPPVVPQPETGIDLKKLSGQLWRATMAQIRRWTNQIPPLVSRWSKDLSHWIGDRIQAMQSEQLSPPTTTVEESQATIEAGPA